MLEPGSRANTGQPIAQPKPRGMVMRGLVAVFAPVGRRTTILGLLSALAFTAFFLRPAWLGLLDGSGGIYWPALLPGLIGAHLLVVHTAALIRYVLRRTRGWLNRYGEQLFTAIVGAAIALYGLSLLSLPAGSGASATGGVAVVTAGVDSLTLNALNAGRIGTPGEYLKLELTGVANSDRPYLALISSGDVRIDRLGSSNGFTVVADAEGSVPYIDRLIAAEPGAVPFTVGVGGIELSPGRVSLTASAPWFEPTDVAVHVVPLADHAGPFTTRLVAHMDSFYARQTDPTQGDLLQLGCASDLFSRSYNYNEGVGLRNLVSIASRSDITWSVPRRCDAHLFIGRVDTDGELTIAGKSIEGRLRDIRMDGESFFPSEPAFASGSTSLTLPDTTWRFVSSDAGERIRRGDYWAAIWIALGLGWLGSAAFGFYGIWTAPKPRRTFGDASDPASGASAGP